MMIIVTTNFMDKNPLKKVKTDELIKTSDKYVNPMATKTKYQLSMGIILCKQESTPLANQPKDVCKMRVFPHHLSMNFLPTN